MAVIRVGSVRPEGGDFIGMVIDDHRQRSVFEAGFRQALPAENRLHLLRPGGGAKVPVMRVKGKKRIADTAAYGVGGIAGLLQPVNQARNLAGQFHRQASLRRRTAYRDNQ